MCLRLPMLSGALRGSCAALLVLLAACAGAAGAGREPLAVPSCCAAGSALAPDALRADVLTRAAAAAACREQPEPRPWTPLVYQERRHLMQRDKLPQHWSVAHGALPSCDNLRVLPEHAAPYALLAANGYLFLRSAGRSLPLNRYCSDVDAALVCLEDDEHPPSKCCAKGHVYDGAGCVENAPRAAAALSELHAFATAAEVAAVPVAAEAGREPLLGAGWPACAPGSRYSVRGALAGSRLEANGSLRLADGALLAGGAWCAEALAGPEGAHVLACGAGAAHSARSPRHVLYGCGLAVGAAFLAVALAACCAMPATQHALHWRCQTEFVASLLLADLHLAGTQLAGDRLARDLCRYLAACMYFLFLAAFFWLNTMCFNIWWSFRDFRLTSLEPAQDRWRLRVYAAYGVYAWGGPMCAAYCAARLDALPPPPAGPALLRPRFGVERCWFTGDAAILAYFSGPVGVLLLVNLALLGSATRQLACGLWRRDEDESSSDRAALGRVCAKLVVVMGVTWGADVASWAAGGPEYVCYGTDLLSALRGVLVSLAVGAQPAARGALRGLPARAVAACRRPRARCSWTQCANVTLLILSFILTGYNAIKLFL